MFTFLKLCRHISRTLQITWIKHLPLAFQTILFSLQWTSRPCTTNIPHDEGIKACWEVWDRRTIQQLSTESLLKLLEHVLKLNNFMFNGEHYKQIRSTAMGTKMAPSYANTFNGKIGTQPVLRAPFKPLGWLRFLIRRYWDEMDWKLPYWLYITFANSFHNSIKFTVKISSFNKMYFWIHQLWKMVK